MDKALKQRLVGASVLIVLAVIVLPMLLSGRSDRLKHESSRIELPPKPEELSIETRRFPVGVPNRPEPIAVEGNKPLSQETLDVKETDFVSSKIETQASVSPNEILADDMQVPTVAEDELQAAGSEIDESQTPPETGVKAPAVTSITLTSEKPESLQFPQTVEGSEGSPRYLVQVASFSNEKNANALANLLKTENFPVLMDVVDRPAGRMFRVRVGPYAKRTDADSVVSGLATKMTDLTPRVLDLRPDDSAPVSTPSDPLVRWVVQVGSFSNSKSAENLVAKLRLSSLSAFSEKVSSPAGTVYKVRIGPELNRDRATELARKVKAEHSLDAFVTTQE